MTSIPDGVWVNVGSGPNAPAGWTSIDGMAGRGAGICVEAVK